jgi:hypothetical protein
MENIFARASVVVTDAIETEVLGRTLLADCNGVPACDRYSIYSVLRIFQPSWNIVVFLVQ